MRLSFHISSQPHLLFQWFSPHHCTLIQPISPFPFLLLLWIRSSKSEVSIVINLNKFQHFMLNVFILDTLCILFCLSLESFLWVSCKIEIGWRIWNTKSRSVWLLLVRFHVFTSFAFPFWTISEKHCSTLVILSLLPGTAELKHVCRLRIKMESQCQVVRLIPFLSHTSFWKMTRHWRVFPKKAVYPMVPLLLYTHTPLDGVVLTEQVGALCLAIAGSEKRKHIHFCSIWRATRLSIPRWMALRTIMPW